MPPPHRVPPPFPGGGNQQDVTERFIEPSAPPISEHYSEIGHKNLGLYANARHPDKR